ncbi:MAG TPA: response regulator [Lacunisphaera sp.]|nr:response regulator [Lacunisphaera sp.]
MKPIILVADDDDNDLRMIEMALNESGRSPAVRFVHDGGEALDYLYGRGRYSQGRGESPALVLLDLHMPRVDGWEVLRQVKADERLKSIPVVIFSSSARESDVRHCYDLGANAYVVKPIEFPRFQEVVGAIKTFWADCNHSLRPASRNLHPTNPPFA